jgi:hypothetical protein
MRATPTPNDIANVAGKVQALIDRLRVKYALAKEPLDAIVNTLLCRSSLILFFPFGKGISRLVEEVASGLSLSLFSYTVSQHTEPAELFGLPLVSPERGQRPVLSRRGLQHSHIAYLGGDMRNLCSSILNALNGFVDCSWASPSEDVILRSLILRCPDRLFGNDDLPLSLLDRVPVKLFLEPCSADGLAALIREPVSHEETSQPGPVTLAEQDVLHSSIPSVRISDVLPAIQQVRGAVAGRVLLSDRQLVRSARLMCMSALRRGAEAAVVEDLWCLQYLGATSEEQSILREAIPSARRGTDSAAAPSQVQETLPAARIVASKPDPAENDPAPSYRGGGPYAFVSYCHSDGESVYREIRRLYRQGYPIWYDEGIQPASEWPEDVASALCGCSVLLAFLSPRAVASRNVRNEIHFALKLNKPILVVYLADTTLPPGLELQVGTIQAIVKPALPEDRYQRLVEAALQAHIGPLLGKEKTDTQEC